MGWFGVEFETLQGEPKENVAAADDGKDASCKSDDIDPVEEHAQGVDRSIGEVSCLQLWFFTFSGRKENLEGDTLWYNSVLNSLMCL